MSDEKRQTRLLPFRLRRAGATGRADGDISEDTGADAELTALLRTWDAPQPSHDARARLLADFRASSLRVPLWQRALTASVRVPLPVAACAVVALVASLVGLAARASSRSAPVETQVSSVAPVVRVVEVPVIHEKVVTRVVYVGKNERDESRGVPVKVAGGGLAATGAREPKPVAETRDAGEPASFITRVDMADFRPADDIKIRVIKKGRSDEN
ncbi:MAG TPA: hypothetical protein VEX60_11155 [Pyrinomonadaceae bacterium]|nr:hypothetical protein [Pyrinomonadaceae bacterium]